MSIALYPLNDLSVSVPIANVNASGVAVPVTVATITAFLATSNDPAATAADPTFVVTPVYTGTTVPVPGGTAGVWLVQFDAAANFGNPALIDSLFRATPPWLIVQTTGGIRIAIPLSYTSPGTRVATVT
jgi:hypothetical protein